MHVAFCSDILNEECQKESLFTFSVTDNSLLLLHRLISEKEEPAINQSSSFIHPDNLE